MSEAYVRKQAEYLVKQCTREDLMHLLGVAQTCIDLGYHGGLMPEAVAMAIGLLEVEEARLDE